jgi:CO/xanthine dehydrogenase FAD-binding subunit
VTLKSIIQSRRAFRQSLVQEVSTLLARPGLPGFEYVRAQSAVQVHELLQKENVRMMMGGTDLFPQMRDGAFRPSVVVDVKDLPGMRQIAFDPAAGLTLGAAATMNQVATHADIRSHYPALAQAAHSVASYQIRNRATIGGNVCNASPCADTSPAVTALEGVLILSGPDGQREVPASEFFLGPGQTALKPGEFLAAIRLPPPPAGSVGCYQKLGRSRLGDLSLVGVAAVAYSDRTARSGYRFRLALGSVAPVPLRALAAEGIVADRPPGEEAFQAAAQKAMEAATPITDVRASASYQALMVRTMTLRALRAVWARLA